MRTIAVTTVVGLVGFLGTAMVLRGLTVLVFGIVGLAAIVAFAALVSLVRVPADKYLEVNWSFVLSPRPKSGHFIVPQWHQGVWAKIFGPGWRWIWFVRLFGKLQFREFTEIKPDTYGLVEALDGEVPPPEKRQVVSSKEGITYETITDGERQFNK